MTYTTGGNVEYQNQSSGEYRTVAVPQLTTSEAEPWIEIVDRVEEACYPAGGGDWLMVDESIVEELCSQELG